MVDVPFQVIRNVLEDELGYNLHYKVLNSLNYGVPQNRERVFIVGFKDKVDFEFPEPVHLSTTVRDLLEDEVDERFYIREDHKHYKPIAQAVTNPDKVYQWRWSYVRENKKNVCPTLLASYMQPTIILTDKGIRGITPREAFRIQGFPDSFKLPDLPDKVLMHQVGNSVTVPIIKSIAQRIHSCIPTQSFVRHIPCDNCGSSDGNALYSNGSAFCFVCHTYSHSSDSTFTPKVTHDISIQGSAPTAASPWTVRTNLREIQNLRRRKPFTLLLFHSRWSA